MDKFLTDVADALAEAGATTADHYKAAHRIVSEVETTLMRPEAFAARLQELSGRLGEVLCAAVGAPVGRLLITPVPDYVAAVLPEILSEFPAVVLADNYKAGTLHYTG
jgi:hypothetical protein